MKWIGKGKAWLYVNDDDSVIDRVIYENGMYQSMRHCRSYVSLSGMKKFIEYQHSVKLKAYEAMEHLPEPKKKCSLAVLEFFTWSTVGVALVAIVLMFFTLFAHADAKDIRDMLNTFAPAPRVVYIQPSSMYPTPPAYLPPVRGQVLEPVDFMPARLHETPSINLLGDSNE